MNALRPWLNTFLLVAILTTLLLIWRRMPPTRGEMQAAKEREAKKALFDRSPFVRVELSEPISVDVAQPLEVTITQ